MFCRFKSYDVLNREALEQLEQERQVSRKMMESAGPQLARSLSPKSMKKNPKGSFRESKWLENESNRMQNVLKRCLWRMVDFMSTGQKNLRRLLDELKAIETTLDTESQVCIEVTRWKPYI